MRVDLFDFDLPQDRIATHPASPRDSSRMLYLPAEGTIQDKGVRDIPSLLRPGDVMVFNDTRVIPARLMGKRDDVPIEILLHKSAPDDVWLAFAKPAKRLKDGQTVQFAPDFSATVLGRTDDGQVRLRFHTDNFLGMLDRYGEMPLPPYMRRHADKDDTQNYQTAYARHPGSVAAPTAGLHFTPELLQAIDDAGAVREHVTLHVGAGTFLPVKVDDTRDHVMHSEVAEISAQTADAVNTAKREGRRIIAVGTTSLRTLESMSDEQGRVKSGRIDTNLFITPGYQFRIVDALMTNFHLPRSTLLMLVSAFAGRARILDAYRHAVDHDYRFYSYGDACWLEKTGDQA